MDGMAQFRAIVHGHVQGVYFRATTVEKGRELGLRGFARNRPDGTVEVVAAGPRDALARLIEFLNQGPRPARVDAVDLDWEDTTDAPEPFCMRP